MDYYTVQVTVWVRAEDAEQARSIATNIIKPAAGELLMTSAPWPTTWDDPERIASNLELIRIVNQAASADRSVLRSRRRKTDPAEL